MNSLVDSIELGTEFEELAVFAVGGLPRLAERLRLQNKGVEPSVSELLEQCSDVDLAVEGSTPDELMGRGFKLIQNEEDRFPVFLDSEGREVALARTEQSTGRGHSAFKLVSDPTVSIEEDLERRDFTANAMAVALTDSRFAVGDLIDPFNGAEDIEDEVLRMVHEESFEEDPLRILRMARFAARLDFDVEPETLEAAQKHVNGLTDLPRERWGLELIKAMKQAQRPSRFFRLLDDVDALPLVLPELDALKGVPAGPEEYHGEEDSFEHTMLVLDEMANLRPGDYRALFAALAHDFGKGLTLADDLPSHPTHHKDGVTVIPAVRERLVLPAELAGSERYDGGGVMGSASRHHMKMHDIDILNASTVLELVESLRDDYEVSNPGDEPVIQHVTLDELIDLAIADSRGRIPSGEFDAELARARFDNALDVLDNIGGDHVFETFDEPQGEQFGQLLHQERVRALKDKEALS